MTTQSESVLASTLESLDPQEVLRSPVLLASFKDFFSRDNSGELRQQLRLSLAGPRTSPKRTQVSACANLSTPSDQQASEDSVESGSISFFKSTGVHDEKRLGRLDRAVRGFISVSQTRNDSYEAIWASRDGLFQKVGNSPNERIKCLFRGHSKLGAESHLNICARRITLVFIHHEVESYTQGLSSPKWRKTGEHRKTGDLRAFRWIADQTGLLQGHVQSLWHSSGNYMKIMQQTGPGMLVLLGNDVSNLWEKQLNKKDVKLLLDYHAQEFCASAERIETLNRTIGSVLFRGLENYGFDSELFRSGETKLIQCLRKYRVRDEDLGSSSCTESGSEESLESNTQANALNRRLQSQMISPTPSQGNALGGSQGITQPPSSSLTQIDASISDDPISLRLSSMMTQMNQTPDLETYKVHASSTNHRGVAPNMDVEVLNDFQGLVSHHSRVLPSPSTPQVLFVAQNLLHHTKVYFEDSCQNMNLDDHGTLLDQHGAQLHNDLCNDFDSYCFTATMLLGKQLGEEFRHALSKAFALVGGILRAEHPLTLACFLEVLTHLNQTGLPEVASSLRDFIKSMSAQVTRKGHPWSQICWLLGELDSNSLDQAMAQIWKCTIDTFDSKLGTFGRFTVSARLDYIKRVYGNTNPLEEERLLRHLLAQLNGIPRSSTPRVMLNLAHNLNRQGRHDEAEEMALKVLSLFQESGLYADRIFERIECNKIVSHSQFHRGKRAAEKTIREAIGMIVDQCGRQHSWFLEFNNVLESWLQEWGRGEDANALRREMGELIKTGDA